MKRMLPFFTLAFIMIFTSVCFTAEASGYYTDWFIVDSWISPSKPEAGQTVNFYVKVGILTLIDPLPQTVDVACYVDETLAKLASLTFTNPLDVQTVSAVWKATEGKHTVTWQIDPDLAYNDPNKDNNISTLFLDVAPPTPTEATATTTLTEILTTTVTVEEEIRTETKTITEYQASAEMITTTLTEAITATQYACEPTYLATVAIVIGAAALTVGFLFGRTTAGKRPPEDPCAETRKKLQEAERVAFEKAEMVERADFKAKEAQAEAERAREELDKARSAHEKAEKAVEEAERLPEEGSWIESHVMGERKRITEHDLRLGRDSSKQAWDDYKSGRIGAKELEERWKRLGEDDALKELRKRDEETRRKLLDEARAKEAEAKEKVKDAAENLDKSKSEAEKAQADAEVARRDAREAGENADRLRRELEECERRTEIVKPPTPTPPPVPMPPERKIEVSRVREREPELPMPTMPAPREGAPCPPPEETLCVPNKIIISPYHPESEEAAGKMGVLLDMADLVASLPTSKVEAIGFIVNWVLGKLTGEFPSPGDMLSALKKLFKGYLAKMGVYVWIRCRYLKCENRRLIPKETEWTKVSPPRYGEHTFSWEDETWSIPEARDVVVTRQMTEEFYKVLSQRVAAHCLEECPRRKVRWP